MLFCCTVLYVALLYLTPFFFVSYVAPIFLRLAHPFRRQQTRAHLSLNSRVSHEATNPTNPTSRSGTGSVQRLTHVTVLTASSPSPFFYCSLPNLSHFPFVVVRATQLRRLTHTAATYDSLGSVCFYFNCSACSLESHFVSSFLAFSSGDNLLKGLVT